MSSEKNSPSNIKGRCQIVRFGLTATIGVESSAGSSFVLRKCNLVDILIGVCKMNSDVVLHDFGEVVKVLPVLVWQNHSVDSGPLGGNDLK